MVTRALCHLDTRGALFFSADGGPEGALRSAAAQVGREGPCRAARVGLDTPYALGGRDAPRGGGTGKTNRAPPTPEARIRTSEKVTRTRSV